MISFNHNYSWIIVAYTSIKLLTEMHQSPWEDSPCTSVGSPLSANMTSLKLLQQWGEQPQAQRDNYSSSPSPNNRGYWVIKDRTGISVYLQYNSNITIIIERLQIITLSDNLDSNTQEEKDCFKDMFPCSTKQRTGGEGEGGDKIKHFRDGKTYPLHVHSSARSSGLLDTVVC